MRNRILVVEDDPSLREWVNFELEGEGYNVSVAEDGDLAMEALGQAHLPDLVLLDVQLPGKNGFEICAHLKNNPVTAAIPVIFLTSRATLDDKLLGFDAGAADYLPKPFTMVELKARVKALLRQTELGRQQGQAEVEEEMAQAAVIQNSLMPRVMPQVAGVDVVARSMAAKMIGGDFYDLYARPDGQLCLVEADVSGKGLAAALIMTSARTAVRGSVRRRSAPEEVMSDVCEHLYDDLTDVEKFITTVLAFYDPVERQLSYSNAGHALALYCPAEGPVEVLEADGPPLGVLAEFEYAGHTRPLLAGDIFALVSDGIFEAVDAQENMFGHERLLDFISRERGKSAQEILDNLFEAVAQFAGDIDQFDDQTCVILKGRDA